ncbi:SigE family RNA polymerase sigma factor [Nocardioides flavescens]|uniref:SigE family RNA polymerase sigma factor n=1 Tax=Nocardioides flavescens TaxID=2691959 RepID=A0A6L7F4F4_9ACTN|nr:SigE family RNA polymerase sigma factor [Nocardioides flavescens]
MRRAEVDEAFRSFVATRHTRLLRAAYLLCGDHYLAEDLVQTTLVKLYAAWPRASRADSIDAYARRVLVNSHRDELRRPWRRERPAEHLPDDAKHGLGVEVKVGVDGEHDDLMEALRRLPVGQRRVVVLRHYWGLSVEETAADLGVTTGTVKSQTSRALAALARVLSAHQPASGGMP